MSNWPFLTLFNLDKVLLHVKENCEKKIMWISTIGRINKKNIEEKFKFWLR